MTYYSKGEGTTMFSCANFNVIIHSKIKYMIIILI